ncbi:MAG: GDP-mannose 4,6-dehydratase [Solirubrobacterales bacterium]
MITTTGPDPDSSEPAPHLLRAAGADPRSHRPPRGGAAGRGLAAGGAPRGAPARGLHLAAMSSVSQSWSLAVATAEYTAVGVTRLLEAIRNVCPGSTCAATEATPRSTWKRCG